MRKIMVASDLSVNSISAILFAYKFAQTNGGTLVIVHVFKTIKPKKWRTHRFENFIKTKKEFFLNKLYKQVHQIIQSVGGTLVKFEIEIHLNSNITGTIIKTTSLHQCDCICISTHGTGRSKKVLGSTACKLIIRSSIPIISVPISYKISSINNICYVSDMLNYLKELKKTVDFLKPNSIKILHLSDENKNELRPSQIETKVFKKTGYIVKFQREIIKSTDILLEGMAFALKKMRPSIIVFFIKRNHDPLIKILSNSSKNKTAIFKKVPVLFFKK